jgi:hypothetical protein
MESEENREIQSQSLSKEQAIALLQNTIQQLETIVRDLDTSQQTDLVLDSSVNTLVETTKELAATITPPAVVEENTELPLSTPATETVEAETTETKETPKPEPAIASPPVAKTPPSSTVKAKRKTKKANKPLLIGVISGVIIIVAIALWQLFPSQPAQLISQNDSETTEPEIAIATDPGELADTTIPDNISIIEKIEEPEAIEKPEIVVDTTSASEDLEANVSDELNPDKILAIDIPAELISPGKPQTIKLKPIEPEITLSPEQSLIAAIQARVAEITQDYSEDLVTSVQADFINSNLSVKISNLWYELNESRQNKMANEILKRARQLDFQRLEITDPQGILVARSPVVGDKAIILQTTIVEPNDQ